jgi:hypothetical protein
MGKKTKQNPANVLLCLSIADKGIITWLAEWVIHKHCFVYHI